MIQKEINYYKRNDFPAEVVALIISIFEKGLITSNAKAYHFIIEEYLNKADRKQSDIIGYCYWLQDKYNFKTDNKFYKLNENIKFIYDTQKNNIDSVTRALDTLDKLSVTKDISKRKKLINDEINKLSTDMTSEEVTKTQKWLLEKFIELLGKQK